MQPPQFSLPIACNSYKKYPPYTLYDPPPLTDRYYELTRLPGHRIQLFQALEPFQPIIHNLHPPWPLYPEHPLQPVHPVHSPHQQVTSTALSLSNTALSLSLSHPSLSLSRSLSHCSLCILRTRPPHSTGVQTGKQDEKKKEAPPCNELGN